MDGMARIETRFDEARMNGGIIESQTDTWMNSDRTKLKDINVKASIAHLQFGAALRDLGIQMWLSNADNAGAFGGLNGKYGHGLRAIRSSSESRQEVLSGRRRLPNHRVPRLTSHRMYSLTRWSDSRDTSGPSISAWRRKTSNWITCARNMTRWRVMMTPVPA